ncbi:hypothetical protein P7K49_035308 [Saguinus oedipus]|uniref:Uncharacterized protein n=1 Tax=Saguinus oedipus TaxID=9490 RepID=A0ABQ9TN91_SAGOE|nr:hypothetical protein P7K49_035308 [Saguinus oedipus]
MPEEAWHACQEAITNRRSPALWTRNAGGGLARMPGGHHQQAQPSPVDQECRRRLGTHARRPSPTGAAQPCGPGMPEEAWHACQEAITNRRSPALWTKNAGGGLARMPGGHHQQAQPSPVDQECRRRLGTHARRPSPTGAAQPCGPRMPEEAWHACQEAITNRRSPALWTKNAGGGLARMPGGHHQQAQPSPVDQECRRRLGTHARRPSPTGAAQPCGPGMPEEAWHACQEAITNRRSPALWTKPHFCLTPGHRASGC